MITIPLTRSRRAASGALAALVLLTAAACGSSTASSVSDEDVNQEGLQQARELVAEFSKQPTRIPNATPIGKPVPKGKRVTFLSCGTSTCNLEADIIKQATDALGWEFTAIANDGTPEGIKKGWQQILRDKPDGVLYPATPVSAFKNELDQAAEMGIEVVACCTTDPADGEKLDFVIGTPEQSERPGELMAAYIVDKSDGKGNALFVNVSAFEIIGSIKKGYDKVFDETCEACGNDVIDIPITALGKDVPDRIVSYLRSNPNTKYVALSIDGALGAGLPAALKAAGLNDVTVIGVGPDETTLQYISGGLQEATITFPYYEEMFSMVDALARKFAGVEPDPDVEVPDWIVTKDTLPTDKEIFPVVADVSDQYFKLWGVN
ncbi:ribose transport system substrate-binding protein [Nocardioides sp. J9]|uniref:sugar ABC transporter substrate-binding protein n=1 Tax=Nocardioides sp. J9 TaxID=935844 RepID=UPI00119ECB3D|nr:substrate-binding domain-containing protein [Nocardioides sp. J9]TWG96341.1 ribose transport system substrate-binding protein [Nocardioides sp. J9]